MNKYKYPNVLWSLFYYHYYDDMGWTILTQQQQSDKIDGAAPLCTH